MTHPTRSDLRVSVESRRGSSDDAWFTPSLLTDAEFDAIARAEGYVKADPNSITNTEESPTDV